MFRPKIVARRRSCIGGVSVFLLRARSAAPLTRSCWPPS
jgi:hypothetical protein